MSEHAPREQLEGGLRRLVGVAGGLARLHLVEQRRDARVVLLDGDAEPLDGCEDARLARLLRHQQVPAVADALGRHVLVGRRLLDDGRGVDAGLGRERALADVGRMPVGRPVQNLVEHAAGVRQLAAAARA